jgi:hypothetical protein
LDGGVEVCSAEEEAAAVAMRVEVSEGDEVVDAAGGAGEVLGGLLDAEPRLPHPTCGAGVWLCGSPAQELGDALGERVQEVVGDGELEGLGAHGG